MARPDKEAAVAALADKFRQADAVLLTEYRGLSVAQLKELRRSLAGNAEYTVVKNTACCDRRPPGRARGLRRRPHGPLRPDVRHR